MHVKAGSQSRNGCSCDSCSTNLSIHRQTIQSNVEVMRYKQDVLDRGRILDYTRPCLPSTTIRSWSWYQIQIGISSVFFSPATPLQWYIVSLWCILGISYWAKSDCIRWSPGRCISSPSTISLTNRELCQVIDEFPVLNLSLNDCGQYSTSFPLTITTPALISPDSIGQPRNSTPNILVRCQL